MIKPGFNVSPLEKIISILSYLTMGLVGLICIVLTFALKKRLKYFLMYNISQSMIISIILAIINISLQIIFTIVSQIKPLDFMIAVINTVMSYKVLTIYPLGMSFSLFQLFVSLVIFYISIGVLMGRIFYIPGLSKLMNKVMYNYG